MKTILVVGENCAREQLVELAGQLFPWNINPLMICDLAGALECIEVKRPEILLLWLSQEFESWCKGLANRLDPGSIAFWMHDSFHYAPIRFHAPNLVQSGWNNGNGYTPKMTWDARKNGKENTIKRILLNTLDSTLFADLNDILYCKAEASYCRFVFENAKDILISKPMKEIEMMLEKEGFFRVHKSFLVQISKVKAIHRADLHEIELEKGIRIPIAYRKKEEFMAHFQQHAQLFIA